MDPERYVVFNHHELATMIVKEKGIHEGFWSVYVEFKVYGVNFTEPTGTMSPAAIVPVPRIGIQRYDVPNAMTIDAAIVNPAMPEESLSSKAKRKFDEAKKKN